MDDYNAGPDVLTAMITSSRRRWEAPDLQDVRLRGWQSEGLLHPSVLSSAKLRDLEKILLEGPIGRLTADDQRAVSAVLIKVLGLNL